MAGEGGSERRCETASNHGPHTWSDGDFAAEPGDVYRCPGADLPVARARGLRVGVAVAIAVAAAAFLLGWLA